MRAATPKTRRKRVGFDPSFYVKSHNLSRSGLSVRQIGKSLGVPPRIFQGWVKSRPALKEAIDSGKAIVKRSSAQPQAPNAGQTFLDYVYKQLPPDLQEVWESIEALDEEQDDYEAARKTRAKTEERCGKVRFNYQERIDRLFTRCGVKRARQSLWIHALVSSNFNANEACRKVGISRATLDGWRNDEPAFDRLIREEIHRCKKDFGEAMLLNAMSKGEPACIIFFAKTQLADRGYVQPARATVTTHGPTGSVEVEMDLDDVLDKLPLEQRRSVLKQLEAPKTVESVP
jgi:hypothetical protein